MRTLLLTLHVVLAIFLIGPLVAVANQATRALTDSDAGALRPLARTLAIYGWASIAVGVLGAGLAQRRYGHTFGEAWLATSAVLWLIATVLVVGLLAPLLRRAVATAAGGTSTAPLVGRAASLGGVVSLLYVVIAVLMAWQPGS